MAGSILIPDIVEENPNGIFASNPIRATLPVIAAPTQETRKDAHNLVRQELIVVACANLNETNFAFDSSVVDPKARDGFTSIAAVLRRHPGAPMSIFGHADPTGKLRYNQFLSERRARAIFAVLVRDVKIWEKLFSDPEEASGDVWGVRALQTMLIALDAGVVLNNQFDENTRAAIRALLALAPNAPVANTAATRALIFAKYMDFLRGAPQANPPFPSLTPNDFLGRGKQKGTLQGCSAFNPQLLMSQTEQTTFDKDPKLKDSRDAFNEPNRRVVIYLFKAGTTIDPAMWPCPAASQGPELCKARQWSNGQDRRSTLFVNHRRRFGREVRPEARELNPPNSALADVLGREETTFGCRFYHGVALHSPCERDLKLWAIQLLVDAPTPVTPNAAQPVNDKVPLANRRFVAVVGTSADAPTIRGRTSNNGMLALPLFDPNVPIILRIDAFAALAPPKPKDPAVDPSTDPPPIPDDDTPSTDSNRFDDEDQFMQLRLAAGSLRAVRKRDEDSFAFDEDFDKEGPAMTSADRELPGLQRLYNLGFGTDLAGGPSFGNWTGEDRKRFITQFQVASKLPQSGVIDVATADALFGEYGS